MGKSNPALSRSGVILYTGRSDSNVYGIVTLRFNTLGLAELTKALTSSGIAVSAILVPIGLFERIFNADPIEYRAFYRLSDYGCDSEFKSCIRDDMIIGTPKTLMNAHVFETPDMPNNVVVVGSDGSTADYRGTFLKYV